MGVRSYPVRGIIIKVTKICLGIGQVKVLMVMVPTEEVMVNKSNPVAKHARRFNKATVHRDKTKYCRKAKYKGPLNRGPHFLGSTPSVTLTP